MTSLETAVLVCEFCGCRQKRWKPLPLGGWHCDCCGAYWLQDETNRGKGCGSYERGRESMMNGMENCRYCGMYHPGQTCPRVRAIEYYTDGTVKRVEFHSDEAGTGVDPKAAESHRGEWQGQWPVRKEVRG